jgi:GTP-binding protein
MHEKVAIIGRPNAGKSTLFNRLYGKRKALVHHVPGTTRDRNEAELSWNGKYFTLVDTAGWAENVSVFSEAMKHQVETALQGASLVLFVTDGKDGLHPLDTEISHVLRQTQKRTILVVNKIDNAGDELKAAEFYRLGIENILPISADHGRNIPELLDAISASLTGEAPVPSGGRPIRIILVGKPNVGKSSLVNTLSRQERSIVHDMPGTTREALDIALERNGQEFILIDTPGLHRKKKFRDDMEYLSALSTHHAMENADVAVIVMDVGQGIGETEARIAEIILEHRKACLLVVNKWDLVENREEMVKAVRKELEQKLQFLWWSRLLLVSAKTGQRTEKILDEVQEVYREYSRVVPETELKDTIRHAEGKKPLSRRGEILRIKQMQQVDICPPQFLFTVNDPELVHFSYRRYLENSLRERFSFTGTPLIMKFQRKQKEKK